MDAITATIPVARMLPCGGRMIQVSELRLSDLACLQSALDDEHDDPASKALAAIAAGNDPRAELTAAYDRAEGGPPRYGSPEGAAYFSTPVGMALLLMAATREMTPRLSTADAAALAAGCTASEYDRIWRKAHGTHPLRAVLTLMEMPRPESKGDGPSWGEAIEEVAMARPGLSNEAIYSMTLTEFARARRGGKPVDPAEVETGTPAEREALMAWHAEWWG